MANVDVRRVLVDQESSVDIMYKGLFDILKLLKDLLAPYEGMDLQGFNGAKTTPLGLLDLMVTFGTYPKSKTVKTQFLVLPCDYDYNCIIGRPTLAALGAVTSTVHLKMRFHLDDGEVATISADMEAVKRCFEINLKRIKANKGKIGGSEAQASEQRIPLKLPTICYCELCKFGVFCVEVSVLVLLHCFFC